MPVLNEADVLPVTLAQLVRAAPFSELIVCDGGSDDATAARAQESLAQFTARGTDARFHVAARGRATQMNAAARLAHSDVLLFLHADTVLPEGALALVQDAIAGGAVWGRFDVRLEGQHVLYRVIEFFMNFRSRLTGIATGDQAMFMRADVFRMLGGFPDQPLMEDIELSRRLKWVGRPARIRAWVRTSARRFERRGILRTVGLMWWLRLLYALKVSPAYLARRYR